MILIFTTNMLVGEIDRVRFGVTGDVTGELRGQIYAWRSEWNRMILITYFLTIVSEGEIYLTNTTQVLTDRRLSDIYEETQ